MICKPMLGKSSTVSCVLFLLILNFQVTQNIFPKLNMIFLNPWKFLFVWLLLLLKKRNYRIKIGAIFKNNTFKINFLNCKQENYKWNLKLLENKSNNFKTSQKSMTESKQNPRHPKLMVNSIHLFLKYLLTCS